MPKPFANPEGVEDEGWQKKFDPVRVGKFN
jgi:hypothetical protein